LWLLGRHLCCFCCHSVSFQNLRIPVRCVAVLPKLLLGKPLALLAAPVLSMSVFQPCAAAHGDCLEGPTAIQNRMVRASPRACFCAGACAEGLACPTAIQNHMVHASPCACFCPGACGEGLKGPAVHGQPHRRSPTQARQENVSCQQLMRRICRNGKGGWSSSSNAQGFKKGWCGCCQWGH